MIQKRVILSESVLDKQMMSIPYLWTLFVHCLFKMEMEGCITEIRGSRVMLQPGQFATTLGELSYDCKLSKAKITYGLQRLEKQGWLRSESTGRYTLITVPEWDQYIPDYELA